MAVRFLLVCEGSSDVAMVAHIEGLLLDYGLSDIEGYSWIKGGRLVDKIQEGLMSFGNCDLLLVHRDADSTEETQGAGPERRFREIQEAIDNSGFAGNWVPLIPVTMTESWLLVDEAAIRYAAGRPRDDTPLNLPPINRVELEADPKGLLSDALVIASGTTGRKRKRFLKEIPTLKRQLLGTLPLGGPLEQVPSWVRFRDDLVEALSKIEHTA